MSQSTRIPVHGGTDDGPAIRSDFSSNSHPLGPNPFVHRAVERANRSRYPDPHYTSLRRALGGYHSVDAQRIVVGAGASELIWRLTRCWNSAPGGAVVTDQRTFGEYLRAARALDVAVVTEHSVNDRATDATLLHWCCNPDNPSGAVTDDRIEAILQRTAGKPANLIVADLAYWPFRMLLTSRRLSRAVLDTSWADRVVQLWSPNKLHGLTGVRGAYLILPAVPNSRVNAEALQDLAPSWVLGADGAALLEAHVKVDALQFLNDTAPALRAWKADQDSVLSGARWRADPSALHYGLWQPPVEPPRQAEWHQALRAKGIKLRDAASFGRNGWVRLVCRAPSDVLELVNLTTQFEPIA